MFLNEIYLLSPPLYIVHKFTSDDYLHIGTKLCYFSFAYKFYRCEVHVLFRNKSHGPLMI